MLCPCSRPALGCPALRACVKYDIFPYCKPPNQRPLSLSLLLTFAPPKYSHKPAATTESADTRASVEPAHSVQSAPLTSAAAAAASSSSIVASRSPHRSSPPPPPPSLLHSPDCGSDADSNSATPATAKRPSRTTATGTRSATAIGAPCPAPDSRTATCADTHSSR